MVSVTKLRRSLCTLNGLVDGENRRRRHAGGLEMSDSLRHVPTTSPLFYSHTESILVDLARGIIDEARVFQQIRPCDRIAELLEQSVVGNRVMMRYPSAAE